MCLWSTLYSKEIAALHEAWFFCQLKCPIIDDDLYRSWRFSWKLYKEDTFFLLTVQLSGHMHTRDLCIFYMLILFWCYQKFQPRFGIEVKICLFHWYNYRIIKDRWKNCIVNWFLIFFFIIYCKIYKYLIKL